MATDNNNKVLNVPNLRFPEFTEEWRKYKVSDVLDFYSTNSLSWEQLDYNNEDLYNLHYGLIHVGLPILVDIGQNKLPGIKTECKPKNFELCKEGDVAFADASEDTNDVAKAIEFVNLNNHKTVCGLHTIHGRDNKHLTVLGYKGYAFASPLFHNQIRRIAQGTKIYSISSKNFAECYIGIPSKDEQSKIARLLALIDSRIATQNKIIEDLKKLKVAIRDKQLNTIRKHYGLNYQICDLLDYEQPTKYVVTDTEYSEDRSKTPVLTANKAFILGYTDESFGVYDKGACIILDDFTLDCKYVDFPFKVKSSAIKILTVKNGCSLRYVYEYLNYMNLETTEHKRHYISEIEPMIIAYPTDKKGIDDFNNIMSSFESKIEIENKYLQSLLTQKVYLLSNMFI